MKSKQIVLNTDYKLTYTQDIINKLVLSIVSIILRRLPFPKAGLSHVKTYNGDTRLHFTE